MDEPIEAAFRALVDRAPAPALSVDEIATRARRRATRRRRRGAVAVAAALSCAAVWGVTTVERDPTEAVTFSDAPEPSPGAPEPPTTAATEPPPSPMGLVTPVLAATIEDTAVGTGPGSVEYTGDSWTRCGGCDVPTGDSSYHYGYRAGQSYTVRFQGVQLMVYAPDDHHGGVAAVTVDGRPAATPTIDFLTAGERSSRLVWDSGLLPDGDHAVVVTIGTVEAGRDATVALFDRAEVYMAGTAPPDGPPGPPPGATDPPPGGAAPAAGRRRPRPLRVRRLARPAGGRLGDVAANLVGGDGGRAHLARVHDRRATGTPFDRRWTGKASIGQPMWASGQNAGDCTSGANDQHMTRVAAAIVEAGFGDAYIRLGWEMDGSWFGDINGAWQDPAGSVACWRRWHGILEAASPGFRLVWNPNFSSNTGAGPFDVRTVWPGDEYVDAAGPDYYDWNLDPDGTGHNGAPVGINAWVEFVVGEHGKPFVMPEWGLNAPTAAATTPRSSTRCSMSSTG